jgi:beta-lactamase regulating signal transducer with metallopeptidase domain
MTSADLLEALVRATLASSAALLAVMLARGLVRRAFGAQAAYALWLIAPAATLASFLPMRSIVVATPASASEAVSAGLATPIATSADAITEAATWLAAVDLSLLALAAVAVWALGGLASLALLVAGHRQLVAGLGLSRISRDDRLYRARSEHAGPALVGVLRPRIVVPADFEQRFDPQERSLVLAHERAHLVACDAQINALAALALCVGWFNPLFHIARELLRIDQELACDERVMRRHAGQRRAYAEAMLKTQVAARAMPLGCAWPSRGASALRRRIAMLARPTLSPTRRTLGAALCAACALAACVGASAAQPPRLVVQDTADPVREARARRDFLRALDPALCTRWNITCSGVESAVGDNPGDGEAARLGMLLTLALQNGDIEQARGYIEAGADVDFYIPGDGTPLVIAAQRRDYGTARLLLEAGADVNRAAPGDGLPLIMAAARGDLAMAELLVAHGADVNGYVPGDETPLINAARNNHTTVARYLIEQGADVNLAIDDRTWLGPERRRSPLGEAERNYHFEMIRLLRELGAQS